MRTAYQTPTDNWNRTKNIDIVKNQGFDVDDNNRPAKENIPASDAPLAVADGLYSSTKWGWSGFDQCHINSPHNAKPSFHTGLIPLGKT